MDHENIWGLLAKKLSGEASVSELTELEQLLRANPELHYSVQPLMDLWQTGIHPDMNPGKEAFQRHLRRMEDLGIDFSPSRTDQPLELEAKRKSAILRTTAIVIPLLILVIIGGRMFFTTGTPHPSSPAIIDRQPAPLSEISTRNGSKTTLILPDGTKVWLNAGSKLTYDSSFGKTRREVSLSGEGYFDVVKNKEKAFIIHASRFNIKVLGTEFDVKSYPTDKTTEASLIRGSIEVTFNDQRRTSVILKPNEKIVVDNFKFENHLAQTIENSQAKNTLPEIPKDIAVKTLTHENKTGEVIETSWIENKLVFQDESFEEIARKLERWYGVTIRFENERLKADHLTGSFTNETVRQALDALKFTSNFNYSIDNNNNINVY